MDASGPGVGFKNFGLRIAERGRGLTRSRDFFKNLANPAKSASKFVGMLFLKGRGKIFPVTGIVIQGTAMILHHVTWIWRIGVDHSVDSAFSEASSADDVGNMAAIHPFPPFGLNGGIDGDGNVINDHKGKQ